jgi:hypothetical protein
MQIIEFSRMESDPEEIITVHAARDETYWQAPPDR